MFKNRGLKIREKILLPLVALTFVYAVAFTLILTYTSLYIYPIIFSVIYFIFSYFLITRVLKIIIEDRINSLTKILKSLADGFVSKKADVNDDQIGVMGESVNDLIDTLYNIKVQADDIAKGNLSTRIKPRSRVDMFSRSFNRMAESLENSDKSRKYDEWLKSNQSKLLSMIRNDLETETLAKSILKFLCELLNLQIGAFYIVDSDKDLLKLIAGYSFNERKHVHEYIKPGRGLVGQVYLEKEMITISNPPNDYFDIKWSFGTARPDYIIAIPIVFNNDVLAVMELASIYNPEEKVIDFLNLVLHDIATSIKTSVDNRKVMKLYEEISFQQNTFKTLFENSYGSMRMISKDFRMLDANNKFLNMLGLTRNDIKGKKCFEVFPGKDCHTPNCPLIKIIKKNEDISKQHVRKQVMGQEKDFSLSTRSLLDEEGNIIGIVENYLIKE
jgi:PAS domain S-box-containing protein